MPAPEITPGTTPRGAPRKARRPAPVWLKLLASGLVTAVLLIVAEGGASALLSVREARHAIRMQEESHANYDPDLGWSNRPNLRLSNLYEPGTTFTTNAQGFRAREDYGTAVPPGKYRIVCLGDSFTMGYGMGDADTYPAQMERLHAALQTVNMGQGGYGLDQDYLWYKRDGARLDADLLVFAVIAHDVYRMAGNKFIGYAKPTLRASGGELQVDNTPVAKTWIFRTPWRRCTTFARSTALGRLAAWLVHSAPAPSSEFYGKTSPEVLAAGELAITDLAELSARKRQKFLLVYLPSSDLLAHEPTSEARWLQMVAERHSIPFVNLVGDFGRLPPWEIAPLFRPDFHYSASGNRFVAETLLQRIRELFPQTPR